MRFVVRHIVHAQAGQRGAFAKAANAGAFAVPQFYEIGVPLGHHPARGARLERELQGVFAVISLQHWRMETVFGYWQVQCAG